MKGKRLETQAQWLKEIEPDQNIEGIETAILPDLRARFKKWFSSHVIQPTVALARYNPITGKYELGPEDRNADTLVTSVVSAATTDFVITDGQTWEIVLLGAQNNTRASGIELLYYDGTNSFPLPNHTTVGSTAVAATPRTFETRSFKITGNGTVAIRVVITTFVAADAIRCIFMYRRVN